MKQVINNPCHHQTQAHQPGNVIVTKVEISSVAHHPLCRWRTSACGENDPSFTPPTREINELEGKVHKKKGQPRLAVASHPESSRLL